MTNQKIEVRDHNIMARVGPPKLGREVCLVRGYHIGEEGEREFTLYLSRKEAERMSDVLVDLLDTLDRTER